MNHQYNSIIVTGSVAYDEIMDFPSQFVEYLQPDKLHQINVSFVVDRLEKQLGGTATNISYNLSLVTNKKIILLTSIGKDGKEFLRFFKSRKINTEGVLIDKKLYTATGKVITDIKDNQIWGFYYGASVKAKYIDVTKFNTHTSVMIISANHSEAFLHFQKEAISLHIPYLYDPGMGITWIKEKDLIEGILHSRWLVGNDYEISNICKKIKMTVADLVKKNIIVITTLGEKGVLYQEKNNKIEVPGYKVSKTVDPTGAGDAWRAGFLGSLADGRSIKESLAYANALASFAVEKYGTVNHRPTRKQIEQRVKKVLN
ncbi:MAG: PfkB family carbohydrate kinase [bacterium]|nr:PfkB family carbohydrate kinase [bacterium]